MKTDTNHDLREQIAFKAGWDAMSAMKKFGFDGKTQKVGTKKPLTLRDLNALVQAAVRKALSEYQEAIDEEPMGVAEGG